MADHQARRIVAEAFLDLSASKPCGQCGEVFFRDKRCTWAYWARARFCSSECNGAHNSRRATVNRKPKAVEFARWFEPSDGCWLWTGALDRDGYGIFSYINKTYRAPKIALELDGRPCPEGHYACHHCDTPACVNPAHLYPGTPTQNMADASSRGRTCQGEKQYGAKLTSADVLAIRASAETPEALAPRYGVTRGNIAAVLARKTWRHLP